MVTHRGPKFKYFCAICASPARSRHAELSRTQTVQIDPETTKMVVVKGRGLGGWSCPVHGSTKVRRERAGEKAN